MESQKRILTDNGSEFINKKFKKFCKKNYITLIHGRARHPQTQGAIERYNRTIVQLRIILKHFILNMKEKVLFLI